jgi:TRAP-type C4-dicarboxylate transport system substrate-binding protein
MKRMHQTFCAIASILVMAGAAAADPQHLTVRIGSVAPDGSFWAKELRAMANEVNAATKGVVTVKMYFGGIAGDEVQMLERIERGQLDGAASGGTICMDQSPLMRAVGIRGVFASREESNYVMNRLRPAIEQEFKRGHFIYVAATSLGPDMVFSKKPVRTMDELRTLRVFHWNIDKRGTMVSEAMGFKAVQMPIEEAARALDEDRIDSVFIQPGGLLAFQWTGLVHYYLDMPIGWTYGCLVVSSKTYERLTLEQQQILKAAGAKAASRIDAVGEKQDQELLQSVFPRQGVKAVPPDASMHAQFLAVARQARDKLGDKLIDAQTLQNILAMLADYRAEHATPRD